MPILNADIDIAVVAMSWEFLFVLNHNRFQKKQHRKEGVGNVYLRPGAYSPIAAYHHGARCHQPPSLGIGGAKLSHWLMLETAEAGAET